MNPPESQQGIKENLRIPSRRELWEAIKNNDLTKYTIHQLKEGMLQENSHGDTLYNDSAERGFLNRLPKKLLTQKNLLKSNALGWNALHKAASSKHLDQIPIEVLTAKNLFERTADFYWSETRKEHLPTWSFNCIELMDGDLKKLPKNIPLKTLKEIKKLFEADGYAGCEAIFKEKKTLWDQMMTNLHANILESLEKRIRSIKTRTQAPQLSL
jgi:hypothetical protein